MLQKGISRRERISEQKERSKRNRWKREVRGYMQAKSEDGAKERRESKQGGGKRKHEIQRHMNKGNNEIDKQKGIGMSERSIHTKVEGNYLRIRKQILETLRNGKVEQKRIKGM